MLGSIIKRPGWNWSAAGKHPAARDYLRLGAPSPLMEALADWAAKGYDERLRSGAPPRSMYSWRFWLRGAKKGNLICGLIRDSSDQIGRPFPLMIAGEGGLKGWEKEWISLPDRLSRIWKKLEYIAAHRFDHAGDMEASLNELDPPAGSSPAETAARNDRPAGGLADQMAVCREQLFSSGFGMITVDQISGMDTDTTITRCHLQLTGCCNEIPRGVFMGGTPEHIFMAVILHPLSNADFIRLWTV